MILSPQLEFLMEAHSGMSAKIVEEAGFKGVPGHGAGKKLAKGSG